MRLFLGLILTLLALNFLRDAVNRYVYRYLLSFLRSQRLATLIFSLLFLPGVALHETSHWIMAKLLLVKTQHFSLIPEWVEEETIRFGFVEMNKTDRIRSALIALAPLISGILVVLWLAFNHLHLDIVLKGLFNLDRTIIHEGLQIFFGTPDVFLWLYLLFTISNMMLPSPTDLKAWLPIGITFALIYAIVILISMGSSTSSWLMSLVKAFTETLLKAFGIASLLNLCLIVPLWLLGRLIRRVKGSFLA